MAARDDKYYIVKQPDEQLHQLLVADVENGTLKALSKINRDQSIVYKVFMEDKSKKIKVLVDGEGDNADYCRAINNIEEKMLIPYGKTWQRVKPIIIER
ncbi:hypothetical protein V6C27_00860 [Peptococcaceae bacterium 1198_IL3148]